MSHVLDAVALIIVLACAVYALRALLPRTVLQRLTGNTTSKSGNCGGCNNCETAKKNSDDGCH